MMKQKYAAVSFVMLSLLLVLSGCSRAQRMDVRVLQERTRQPIENVEISTDYNKHWYWPFVPETDSDETDARGDASVVLYWNGAGTFLNIAGTQFTVSRAYFENGGIYSTSRFRAYIRPRPVTPVDEQGEKRKKDNE